MLTESNATPQNGRAMPMRKDCDPQLAWSALDFIPAAVFICHQDGVVLFRNRQAEQMLPAGEAAAEVVRPAEGPELDWSADLAALRQEPEGIIHHGLTLAGAGGRRVLADVHLRLLEQPAGEPAVLVVVEDVSLRASAERRVAVGERLAAEGRVAAHTAHELNNPLDGVLRYVSLAERAMEMDPRQAEIHLAKARDGLLRMAGVIREMLNEGGAARETLGGLVAEAVAAFAPRAEAAGVTVTCDLAGAADAPADGRLFQVFCNVLKNALDAMPAGGVVAIRARAADGRCTVEFADTGYGLSAEQVERMFEPFYTTKPAGGGVGLGLAISREIVTALGGTITAAPGPGGGAVITLTLPVRAAAPAAKGG